MQNRRNLLTGLAGLGGLTAIASASEDRLEPLSRRGLDLFFSFRDAVINFNGSTGVGTHCGTSDGTITGTSVTNFQFIPTSQTAIKFDNRCLISDLDGDQVIFQVVGTGRLLNPIPTDADSPLGNLMAFGGPLVATFTAIVATGKYVFLQGRKFPGKMMATNVSNPSAGVAGNVYGEVYSDSVGVLSTMIRSYR